MVNDRDAPALDSYSDRRSTYIAAVLDHGFVLQRCDEPIPTEAVRAEAPHRLGLPPFLLVRVVLA